MTDLSHDDRVMALVALLNGNPERARDLQYWKLAAVYENRARELGVAPQTLEATDLEREFDRLVPRRRFNFYSEEHREAATRYRQLLPAGVRLPGLASTEVAGFIDGERSVTEIWRLVRGEYGNVTPSNLDWKYAYAVTPETRDIQLSDVITCLQAMAEAGLAELAQR